MADPPDEKDIELIKRRVRRSQAIREDERRKREQLQAEIVSLFGPVDRQLQRKYQHAR